MDGKQESLALLSAMGRHMSPKLTFKVDGLPLQIQCNIIC